MLIFKSIPSKQVSIQKRIVLFMSRKRKMTTSFLDPGTLNQNFGEAVILNIGRKFKPRVILCITSICSPRTSTFALGVSGEQLSSYIP
jgi:hypothetical protein